MPPSPSASGSADLPVTPSADPNAWLDAHGDCLFRYAMIRLRDEAQAEDLVQETLLAALQARRRFDGRSSERTWLVGILKHKIVDHYRRSSREAPGLEADMPTGDELFRDAGEWVGHWKPDLAPTGWERTPQSELERTEFWRVFDRCMSPLPERVARAFTLREIDGMSTNEICDVLGVTTNNLWVMLHRARLRLRQCIEVNWFRKEATS